jgi:hypothetical protein
MTTIRTWGSVVAWALACALLGPLWIGGLALALLLLLQERVQCWVFWGPTNAVWSRLVRAYRLATAKTSPEVAAEVERVRKANQFARRARRAKGGR